MSKARKGKSTQNPTTPTDVVLDLENRGEFDIPLRELKPKLQTIIESIFGNILIEMWLKRCQKKKKEPGDGEFGHYVRDFNFRKMGVPEFQRAAGYRDIFQRPHVHPRNLGHWNAMLNHLFPSIFAPKMKTKAQGLEQMQGRVRLRALQEALVEKAGQDAAEGVVESIHQLANKQLDWLPFPHGPRVWYSGQMAGYKLTGVHVMRNPHRSPDSEDEAEDDSRGVNGDDEAGNE